MRIDPAASKTAIDRFEQLVEAPYTWGINDCCTSIADIVEPVWGFDPIERFRGSYQSIKDFMRIMKSEGCDTLLELVSKIAEEAGASPFEGEPENFDVGFVMAAMEADAPEQIGGLPAFFWQGMWVSITHAGMALNPEALAMWRKPSIGGAR